MEKPVSTHVNDRQALTDFIRLLAPFAPHIGEELWHELGETDSVFHHPWPTYDEEKMKDDEISRLTDEALAAVGLEEAADKFPAEISGGMVKRAGLARAIVRHADAVLYDEPTSGLDPVTAQTIHRLIKRLNGERGLTSLVVTHDLAGACSFADRILMLRDGRVALAAPPGEFLKSDIPAVREYVTASKGEL